MQVGSITEEEASWQEDQWNQAWQEDGETWPDSVWHFDEWNASEWYDDGRDSAWTGYDDGWSSYVWQGQPSAASSSQAPSSSQLLALPSPGTSTSSGSQSSPFALQGNPSTARVGAVVQQGSSGSRQPLQRLRLHSSHFAVRGHLQQETT